MSEKKRVSVEGRGIPVHGNDIDTDRIIPARFMKCVTFDGLGEYAFHDERVDEAGNTKEHPFNDERYEGGTILIVNKNFGCGSSREHAPQSLAKYGVQAIVAESYAEIFTGNCTAMGIPTVTAPHDAVENLMVFVEEKPDSIISIDLEEKQLFYGDFSIDLEMPDASRHSLLHGTWDSTEQLLQGRDAIDKTADSLPYMSN